MKFSEQWLREWVKLPLTTEQLIERLTMAGLEVESVTPVAAPFQGVIVAQVEEVAAHEQSDHLHFCRVNTGTETLQIVCGAANVRAGMCAPLAQVGAQLAGMEKPIGKAKLRGAESFGMLCSAKELGLAESSQGLLELPEDAPLGQPVWDYLSLEDKILELSLTPNRGDCLSIAGLAREIGALTQTPVETPDCSPVIAQSDATLPIEILAPNACPRYAGRVVHGVNAQARTPVWMQERLRRGGQRSINAVVDITNYVMLELGQPMHAFDLAKLQGGIKVRMASAGEPLAALDGQQLELSDETLVIADHAHALAVAGVIGGSASGVTNATQDVFLESAFFTPAALAGQARRYHVQTESSFRFERGVDFSLQAKAIERATALLLAICGGKPGPVTVAEHPEALPQRPPITLRASRVQRLLGIPVSADEITQRLTGLGLSLTGNNDTWQVVPPPFRFDIALEADLIEEIARTKGYEHIPSRLPQATLQMKASPEAQVGLAELKAALIHRGYHEAITYSFVEPGLQARLDPESTVIPLSNPISQELGVMRTSMLPGLVQAAIYNLNRQNERVRLFESGLVYTRRGDAIIQEAMLGGVSVGDRYPEQWGVAKNNTDFHDLRGDIEALFALGGTAKALRFVPATNHPALHPGQSASIELHGQPIGLAGRLQPVIAAELGLEHSLWLFQLRLDALKTGQVPAFRALSKFPLMRRDISFIVDREVPAAKILECILHNSPSELIDFQLFDLYQSEDLDSRKKSIALGLIFQGTSRTLIDKEVDAIKETLITRLNEETGAVLRG